MLSWLRKKTTHRRQFRGGGRKRSARLRKHPFYKQNLPAATERLAAIDKRIMISDENAYIYVRVPKCANSTIVLMLGLEELGMDGAQWANMPSSEQRHLFTDTLKKRTFSHPSRLNAADAANAIASHRRIMFVRNPYTRLASAYLDKVASGKYEEHVGLPADIGFGDFCQYLSNGGLYRNIHWLPQTAITPFPIDSFDFIGRFESLDDDLTRLTRMLHGRNQPTISLASHATHAGEHLHELYGEAEVRIVRELYAEDFARLGYDTENPPRPPR